MPTAPHSSQSTPPHPPRPSRQPITSRPLAALALSGLALLSACTTDERLLPAAPAITKVDPNSTATSAPTRALTTEGILAAVEPATLRINPLTRLEPDSKDVLRLACHLELADRFGQSCRWLGKVRIELYRPADPGSDGASDAIAMSGGERQSTFWEVDITDPDQNALVFDDLVSRTYIFPLVDLPDWVARLAQGNSREPWLTLRAYFVTIDSRGRERILETSARIRRETGNR